MTPAEAKLARELYDSLQVPKPSWDQIGDVTRGVWLKKVQAGLTPKDYLPSPVKKTRTKK